MRNTTRVSRVAKACFAASFLLISIQTVAYADLERIREKAVELEQKLNKHHYEVAARGEDSNTLRIYKDFAFLLKQSKVDEAIEAEGSDPEAAKLKHFLVESAVNFELASYLDDLNKFERTGTADFNGTPTTYQGLINQLAVAEVDKDRRSIYTALKGMVETANIYRNQIVTRRNEMFQGWGYDNYAQFYAEQNGLDLAAVSKAAEDLLTETQAQYDALFASVVMDQMGVESRKVKFLDIPFLMSGASYKDGFPVGDKETRSKAVLGGLGLSSQGLVFDEKEREGRAAGWGVYPVDVPTETIVALTASGSLQDEDDRLFASAKGLAFAMNTGTTFESSYLPQAPVVNALAFLIRSVRGEDAFLENHTALGESSAKYKEFLTFQRLFEARQLAALTLYDIALNTGQPDAEKLFKSQMRTAIGVRLSSTDAKRALEFAGDMKIASEFQGLLVSAQLRKHLVASLGANWFEDQKASSVLKSWIAEAGSMSVSDLLQKAEDTAPNVNVFIESLGTE